MRLFRRPLNPEGTFARRILFRIAGGLAAFVLISVAARAQSPPLEGQPVAAVNVVDGTGGAIPEKIPALPLHPGDLFHFEAERESLRRLYAMGDFSDIRVTAAREPAGLRIDFVVQR